MEAWRERFGESDPDNNLRVAIITGINISTPHAYAVIVGPNMDKIISSPAKVVGFVARVNVMTPTNSPNLDMFLRVSSTKTFQVGSRAYAEQDSHSAARIRNWAGEI